MIKSLLFCSFVLLTLVADAVLLQPRLKAPNFKNLAVTPQKEFKTVQLSDYKGKYLVIVFYPFDFTYVCPTQLISYSDNIDKFRQINTEVIAVSIDSHFSHLAWLNTERSKGGVQDLKIPLITDLSKQMSRDYGVLVEDSQDELYGATLRGLYIIDGNGIIRSITINDAPVGRNVEETIRVIKAFQHSDKYGVVCPANWQPGSRTIIPDQEKKREYFKEL